MEIFDSTTLLISDLSIWHGASCHEQNCGNNIWVVSGWSSSNKYKKWLLAPVLVTTVLCALAAGGSSIKAAYSDKKTMHNADDVCYLLSICADFLCHQRQTMEDKRSSRRRDGIKVLRLDIPPNNVSIGVWGSQITLIEMQFDE